MLLAVVSGQENTGNSSDICKVASMFQSFGCRTKSDIKLMKVYCSVHRLCDYEIKCNVSMIYDQVLQWHSLMLLQRSGEMTAHMPEVILNNFNTRLGRTFARIFAALFPHDPQFHGRRVVTFHNQRDFIFFRQHR